MLSSFPLAAAEKLIIAHRGASAYLPEHILEAKVLAYAMGADYIEQDVVMTQDNQLIVFHDLYLDRMTDVAKKFPGRNRSDGHFYVVDFLLSEIQTLQVSEGFIETDGSPSAIYPQRFPIWQSNFKIHTFADELELIRGLNLSTGKNVGIYTEIKSPWFYNNEGKDISREILTVLKKFGYTDKADKVFLQTFDFNELVRVHDELMPELGMNLKTVQLIAENDWLETFEYSANGQLQPYDYEWMHSADGLKILANFADGIGPHLAMVVSTQSSIDNIIVLPLVERAHALGMKVHPYTFRLDQGQLPEYSLSFEDLLAIFLFEAEVDGVFTDFPDRAADFLKSKSHPGAM